MNPDPFLRNHPGSVASPGKWTGPLHPQLTSGLVRRGLQLARTLEKRHLLSSKSHDPFSGTTNTIGMELVLIPPGHFVMGSPPEERGRKPSETLHRVTLSRGFYLQKTPVTVAQWRSFVEDTDFRSKAEIIGAVFAWEKGKWIHKKGYNWERPGFEQTEDHPVTCISWEDAQAFVDWLDRKEGKAYRLPTEAEWEYACRAGSTTAYSFGDDPRHLGDHGWYWENSGKRPHRVAEKVPNGWGIYDMHGNVWEMCEDRCEILKKGGQTSLVTNTYRKDATDPLCWEGPFRISRGGDYLCPAQSCRSAKRMICAPRSGTNARGFRVAANLQLHPSPKTEPVQE